MSAVVIPDYLQTLLETIATREGFSNGYQINSRPGSNVGDGFQGLMLSVVISGRRGAIKDELVLICKIPPVSELRRKFTVRPFKQEIAAYETLLPALGQFQRDKGIAEADGFFAWPKCYGTYADEERFEFAIVLEDLRHQGFRMWNKYEPIDYQHVRLALSQLGKLHAISFALRQQQPEVFAQFRSIGSSIFDMMDATPGALEFFEKSFDRAIETLQPDDTDEKRKMAHMRRNFKTFFRLATSDGEAEPFTVFCHGDFWNNNLMFQYASSESLQPQRAVLIDWQQSQYCSPVTDLSYFLYTSTEQSLRTAHFAGMLRVYHESLADLLHRLGGSADAQFSQNDLHRQLNTFGVYGLIMAPITVQVVTVKPEDLPDMDAMTEENLDDFDFMVNGSPDAYKVRVRDVVRDVVARGIFGEKHLEWKQQVEKEGAK